MSIASELSALNGYILGAYDEVTNKGGTVPQNKNMANLAAAIASISGGGGGGGAQVEFGIATFQSNVTTQKGVAVDIASYTISDPNFAVVFDTIKSYNYSPVYRQIADIMIKPSSGYYARYKHIAGSTSNSGATFSNNYTNFSSDNYLVCDNGVLKYYYGGGYGTAKFLANTSYFWIVANLGDIDALLTW